MGVDTVDAHADGLAALAPADVAERRDRVDARLRLVGGRDRVLEIEEDVVGRPVRGLLEHLGARARHGELAALEAHARRLVPGVAHRAATAGAPRFSVLFAAGGAADASAPLRQNSSAAATPLPGVTSMPTSRIAILGSGERAEQHQLVHVAEVADAEELPGHLSEPRAEREVVLLERGRDDGCAVESRRHHHRGDGVRVPLRILRARRESPRLHRRAHAAGEPVMARVHVVEPLFEQHVE